MKSNSSYITLLWKVKRYITSASNCNNYYITCLVTRYSQLWLHVWLTIAAIHFQYLIIIHIVKEFINLIFIRCYPRQKFFTGEISVLRYYECLYIIMYIGILNFTTVNIPVSGALFVGWGMIGISLFSPSVIMYNIVIYIHYLVTYSSSSCSNSVQPCNIYHLDQYSSNIVLFTCSRDINTPHGLRGTWLIQITC